MTRRVRGLAAWCALAALAAAPPALAAGAPLGERDGAEWRQRLVDADTAVADAEARNAAAARAYENMRHRRKPRGEARQAILDERAAAAEALAEAQASYDALLEAARRAGVPPGWLRNAAPADAAAD